MKKLILLLFISAATTLNAQWERVGFEGNRVTDICVKDEQIIISVHHRPWVINGVSFYSTKDLGKSWDSLGSSMDNTLNEFEIINDFIFSASGQMGGWGIPPALFRSSTWSNWDTLLIVRGGAWNLFVHNNIIFARTGERYIKSTDLGNSWIDLSLPSYYGELSSVDTQLFFSDDSSRLYNSTEGGLNWNLLSSSPFRPWGNIIKVSEYLLGCSNVGIVRSSNNGADWELFNNGMPYNLQVVLLISDQTIIFAQGMKDFQAVVFYSTDFGENWVNISEGLTFSPETVVWVNALTAHNHHLFAATWDGIWRYNFSTLVDVIDEETFPNEFSLAQNYPNPFNPSTTISWQSPVSSWQTLKVYDLMGREVATLVDEYKTAGRYEFEFDASRLSSGTYFYRLHAREYVETKKLILMK